MADNFTSPVSDMDLMEAKPICGSGQEVGEYDLGLHVAALCKSIPGLAPSTLHLALHTRIHAPYSSATADN